jgi:hypothetical protein
MRSLAIVVPLGERMLFRISSCSIVIVTMLSPPMMAFLGVFDKHQTVEEPDEFNDSSPVLKTSRWGDLPAEFTF